MGLVGVGEGLLIEARGASGKLLSASEQGRWCHYFCAMLMFLMALRSYKDGAETWDLNMGWLAA